MRYYELIEQYKKGALDEESRKQVERDIERHEAVSEYLFEKEEENGFGGGEETALPSDERSCADEEFMRRINRAVRAAFIRMGVIVGAALLVIILFLNLVLPKIVDLFYYDPAKIVGRSDYTETNQMSLDMAVYTELKVPSDYRNNVQAEKKGFGNYDVTVWQTVSYTGKFSHLTGRIEQGELKLYDINYLQPVSGDVFGWFQTDPDSGESLEETLEKTEEGDYTSIAADREWASECLRELEDGKRYQAYVTLDYMMDYPDFISLIDTFDGLSAVWCAPRVNDQDFVSSLSSSCPVGFYTESGVGYEMNWDEESYPDLVLWGTGDEVEEKEERLKDEEYAAEHFAVMLDYMAEQSRFLEMMGDHSEGYGEAADYIRKNGLKIYGFACKADKEALLKMNETQGIYSVWTEELP